MCSPARCSSCGKTTWSGCGMHVDAVLARVPKSQQCSCRAQTGTGAPSGGFSFFHR